MQSASARVGSITEKSNCFSSSSRPGFADISATTVRYWGRAIWPPSSHPLTWLGLTWLRNDVHQRGLAAFHHSQRAANSGAEIFWVGDRAFGVKAHPLGHFGVIDIRIGERGADRGVGDAALVPVGHALHVHHFLMVRAVVVHHAEQGDAVMRGGPQDSVGIHEVAVILDAHAKATVLTMSQCGADGSRCSVAFARAAA